VGFTGRPNNFPKPNAAGPKPAPAADTKRPEPEPHRNPLQMDIK
jgi:hypothetical protein